MAVFILCVMRGGFETHEKSEVRLWSQADESTPISDMVTANGMGRPVG